MWAKALAPVLSSPSLVVHPADPCCPAAVADALRAYLREPGLSYRQPPVLLPDGWETYTYVCELGPAPALPEPLTGPLVLRIYASPQGLPRARHEFAVQQRLWDLGFAVPRPLGLECSSDLFGGPFLLMQRVVGRTLFRTLLRRPWLLWHGPRWMAQLHARLHALSAEDFPSGAGPFPDRTIEEVGAVIRAHGLRGLQPGLDWLWARRPSPPARPSILHLDWHPLNLIRKPDGPLVAIDWTEADVGDPHADVAITLLLLRHAPTAGQTLWERGSVPVGRCLTGYWYLKAYRRLHPLNRGHLAYYRAWAALF
jgi:aminoglycoside phosphotransferase (APT) family kinase protein